MSTKLIIGLAVITALVTTFALIPHLVRGTEIVVSHEIVYKPQPTLSATQIIWLARLMQCESGIKDTAINPNDLDNTPSYGLLQFKPSTYAYYATRYGLASTTDYMNPQGQVTIVTQWLLSEGEVEWTHQFPACVAKIGLP